MKRALGGMLVAGVVAGLAAPGAPMAQGDPERGRYLADPCMGCHGVDGYFNAYPTYHVPKVWGQHAAYLEAALKAYRAGDRPHKTMQAQAATLSDQDIADIAAFMSR